MVAGWRLARVHRPGPWRAAESADCLSFVATDSGSWSSPVALRKGAQAGTFGARGVAWLPEGRFLAYSRQWRPRNHRRRLGIGARGLRPGPGSGDPRVESVVAAEDGRTVTSRATTRKAEPPSGRYRQPGGGPGCWFASTILPACPFAPTSPPAPGNCSSRSKTARPTSGWRTSRAADRRIQPHLTQRRTVNLQKCRTRPRVRHGCRSVVEVGDEPGTMKACVYTEGSTQVVPPRGRRARRRSGGGTGPARAPRSRGRTSPGRGPSAARPVAASNGVPAFP